MNSVPSKLHRVARILLAADSRRLATALVFTCSRKAAHETRLPQVSCKSFPGTSIVRIVTSKHLSTILNKGLLVEQDDVNFSRYMAENFSAFEYKTQEEVFTIINYLTSVLSTTGMQLLETISPSHLLSHLRAPEPDAMVSCPYVFAIYANSSMQDVDSGTKAPTVNDKIPLMRTSVIIGMVMLLKAHLKNLYGLSEEYVSHICYRFLC